MGLIISKDSIRAEPREVNALQNITRPKTKNELISFICMLQSNTDFITNFTKEAAVLKEVIKANTKYEWQDTPKKLLSKFKKETFLAYCDSNKQTYLFNDTYITGFGAILAYVEIVEKAKPIAGASRATGNGSNGDRYCLEEIWKLNHWFSK